MANVSRDAPMAMDMMRKAPAKMEAKSGAGAVQLSIQQNSMQMNSRAVALDGVDKDDKEEILIRNTAQNQFVGNKNFINQSSVWIDSEFAETARLPEVTIKFASDEYFKL